MNPAPPGAIFDPNVDQSVPPSFGHSESMPSGALDGSQTALKVITADYTLDAADVGIIADATGGAIVLTLPPAAGMARRTIPVIGKGLSGSNTLTLDGDGIETINGSATKVMTVPWQVALIYCTGAEWIIVAGNLLT